MYGKLSETSFVPKSVKWADEAGMTNREENKELEIQKTESYKTLKRSPALYVDGGRW